MKSLKADFERNGFCVLKNAVPSEQLAAIYQNTLRDISKCAHELNCSLEDYLRSASRWVHPSPVTQRLRPFVVTTLKEIASRFIGEEVKLSKFNIISKSAHANGVIPCHQDIAYSKADPYEFSLWLPLQTVTIEEGPLEFLPKSHLESIEPAVDFWGPDFVDQMFLSAHWQQNHRIVPVQIGDMIAFDARTWHRSAKNASGLNRFALVSRWTRHTYCPPDRIPDKVPAPFGMWTCGSLTASLLQRGLLNCFQIEKEADLAICISLWKEKLNQGATLPFLIDVSEAQKALKDLMILHQASELHNGGDAQGVIYANAWRHFLSILSEWLRRSETYF